tara:strand:+ start:160 stop:396 length:237 start_codon:yes stop_codon:yes gene_type:complete
MDSFMYNHQSALDSQMEDNAIQDLENAGIYPEPDNDDILESLYEEVLEENPNLEHEEATKLAQEKFEDLPEPIGDYDD